jgi:hypothetical protein
VRCDGLAALPRRVRVAARDGPAISLAGTRAGPGQAGAADGLVAASAGFRSGVVYSLFIDADAGLF